MREIFFNKFDQVEARNDDYKRVVIEKDDTSELRLV